MSRKDYNSHHPHALHLGGQGCGPVSPGKNPPQTQQWQKKTTASLLPSRTGNDPGKAGKQWAMGFVVRPAGDDAKWPKKRGKAKRGNPQETDPRREKQEAASLLQPASPDDRRYLPAQASRGPRRPVSLSLLRQHRAGRHCARAAHLTPFFPNPPQAPQGGSARAREHPGLRPRRCACALPPGKSCAVQKPPTPNPWPARILLSTSDAREGLSCIFIFF